MRIEGHITAGQRPNAGGWVILKRYGIPRCVTAGCILVSISLSAEPLASKPEIQAREVWDILYRNRPRATIRSAQASYLRRIFRAGARPSRQDVDIEHKDARGIDESKVTTAFETYTVQAGRYLVESREYELPNNASLDKVDLHGLTPSRSTDYFWDGEKSVAITRVSEKRPVVTIYPFPREIPKFVEFGRGDDAMPSAEDWLQALEVMGKHLHLTAQRIEGRDVLVLTSGRDGDPGYFLYVLVDPTLDYAVRRVTTKVDGITITDEEYSDFHVIDGLYIPSRGVRKNFRVEGGRSILSTMEEFVRRGTAKLNHKFASHELTRPIPEDAEIRDMSPVPSNE